MTTNLRKSLLLCCICNDAMTLHEDGICQRCKVPEDCRGSRGPDLVSKRDVFYSLPSSWRGIPRAAE